MNKIVRKVVLLFFGLLSKLKISNHKETKLNICSGNQVIPGYISADYNFYSDLTINLRSGKLPFESNSLEVVTCTSGINYFTRDRGQEIINEVFRVLVRGGIARFSSQDLEWLAKRYVDKDTDFFFQKLPNGKERFEGKTMGDKFNSWFYGYKSGGSFCQYIYDYETLADLFISAGFSVVEKKEYMESSLEHIKLIDNRPNQMFFLEAVK
jgi:predicted SAM-dependent methyltransferase